MDQLFDDDLGRARTWRPVTLGAEPALDITTTPDELVRLIPPRPLSLEQALEFIRDDECVEVTPKSIRLRKVELSATKRQSIASRRKRDRDATTA